MKTDVEELSPTRVKLTVEVPFDELKQNLDAAYREVAQQVRIPGFRPGRVPPQRHRPAGRPRRRAGAGGQRGGARALREGVWTSTTSSRSGSPTWRSPSWTTARSWRSPPRSTGRPQFDLPDLDGLPVTVDDAEVTPDQVEEYLGSLRERFASLKGVERPVEDGDFVSIDLAASVDGEAVEDAQASGISYEVGTGNMLDGLDEAADRHVGR